MTEPFVLGQEPGGGKLLMLDRWRRRFGLSAGFTTRRSGNAALHVEDDPKAVIDRRREIAEAIEWPFAAWTCGEQVHGCNVRVVRREEAGSGRLDRASAFADTDAMITNEDGVLLVQFFADCVPLYFHDPVTGAIGLAHAGWKGTTLDIAGQTVRMMTRAYGTNPSDIYAAIGPSIGMCCYEVDEKVIRPVSRIGSDVDLLKPVQGGRAMLDLKECNRRFMIKAGIMPSRIELSSWCTACRTDLFFSHRKEKGKTGRMMSWLGKKSG